MIPLRRAGQAVVLGHAADPAAAQAAQASTNATAPALPPVPVPVLSTSTVPASAAPAPALPAPAPVERRTDPSGSMFFDMFRAGGAGAAPAAAAPAEPSPAIPPRGAPLAAAGQPAVSGPSIDTRLLEAIEDYQAGRFEVAMAKFEGILRDDPTQMTAWVTLGWAYWKAGRKADAYALWNRLRMIDPDNPTVYSLLARAAAADGDLAKAVEYNRKSLELSPNQYGVRYDLARALLWSGKPDEAMDLMEKALAEDPNRYDVMLELAKARTFSWDYEQAVPLWAKLRAQAPDEIDYISNEALCKLHTGDAETARAEAEKVLAAQPSNLIALDVMASLEEFGEHPERALPYLRKLMEAQPSPSEKEMVRVRLIRLLVRLHEAQPRVYSLDEAIQLTRDRLEYDPKSVDAHCLLAELYLMSMKLGPAEEQAIKVLRDFNAYNIRARRALLEVYMAAKEYDRAREQLTTLSQFNPYDPYLYYYLARLESARGDFYAAHRALDRLEAAGQRGAVATLLYHGLTTSEHFVEALSVKRFREHMQALQKAGVRFVKASEIPGLLKASATNVAVKVAAETAPGPAFSTELDARRPAARIPLTVAVTFDDARHDSMRHGTDVGKELGLVFSMHVPCGYILRSHPFICTWEELASYAQAGCWEFGSHFVDAAIVAPISPDGRLGHVLPNLMWKADQNRMEALQEYEQRLALEFPESRKMIQEKLGGPVNFVAYPFGDIGQEVETNVQDPVARILKYGRKTYEAGFIQSVFGFAVSGDDPLLYQRHEIDRWRNGEELVDYVYRQHPVFLARKLRAELAALQGKIYLARDAVRSLEDGGYPKKALAETKKYVNDRLAARFATPTAGPGTIKKAPWKIDLSKPYIGVSGEYFQDNQDRRNWRLFGLGGLNLTPNVVVEGRVGFGEMTQDVQTLVTNRTGQTVTLRTRQYSISLDEVDVGGRASVTFPNGWYVSGDVLQRSFSGDVERDYTAIGIEGQIRPLQPLDVLLHYEHDVAPSALAVVEDITYDMYMINGSYRLRDWWDLTAAGIRYIFDDPVEENTRDHLTLGSMWTLHDRTGLKLGLRYAYASADHESDAYWTPYHLHRYYLEGGFQGTYLRRYYNLRLRVGLGKEDVRPEEQDRYDQTVARARVERWDPGPPPEEDWEWVYGATASTRWPIGDHWLFNGEFSYNKNPNYNEYTLLGGLKYKF